MAKATPALTTFDAGELSPRMSGRVDLAKYFNGCARLENFIPMVQGPAVRRGGTRMVAPTKADSGRKWLVRFQVSEAISYMLEFGHLYVRFFTERGQLVDANGAPVEVATPYTADDLTDPRDGTCRIHTAQSTDTMYIFHRRHQQRKLVRLTATTFELQLVEFSGGPFQNTNTDRALTVVANNPTGAVTLTATGPVFSYDNIGALFYMESEDFSAVRPWAVYQEVNVGDKRRVDFRVYQCTATGAGSAPVTGSMTPTHVEGRAWDGDGIDIADDMRGPIGVEWEYLHSSYGIVRISAVPSPTEAQGVVVDRLPDDVVTSGSTQVIVRDVSNVVRVSAGLDVGARLLSRDHGFLKDEVVTVEGTWFRSSAPGESATSMDGGHRIVRVDDDWFEVDWRWPSSNYVFDANSRATATKTIAIPGGAPTRKWAYALFSNQAGWPEHGAFWRERLVLARDRELVLSVIGDFENFAAKDPDVSTPDAAIRQTLNAKRINRILWIAESDSLVLGTNGDEWIVGPIQPNEAVGQANIRAVSRTTNGSRPIQPVQVGGRLLFVQTSGRKLRDYEYDYASDNFQSTDTTKLADHITRSGIVDLTYQQEPHSIVWAARADGLLVGLTYDREIDRSDVYGWHPHPMINGAVECVESMPAPGGGSDDLWLVVRRTINGRTVRFVEYLTEALADDEAQADAFYVDCGLTYSGPPADTISGLQHLEGQLVDILVDGGAHPQRIVQGGQVSLQVKGSTVHVGLPAPCLLETMNIEAGATTGTAQGKTKRITNVVLRLVRSLGGKLGPATPGAEMEELQFRRPSDPMDIAPPLYTGDTDPVVWPGGYETEGRVRYVNDQPFPVTIAAIFPELQTQG